MDTTAYWLIRRPLRVATVLGLFLPLVATGLGPGGAGGAATLGTANVAVDFATPVNQMRMAYGVNDTNGRHLAGWQGYPNGPVIDNHRAIHTQRIRMWIDPEDTDDEGLALADAWVAAVYAAGARPYLCLWRVPYYMTYEQFGEWAYGLADHFGQTYNLSDWMWEIVNEPDLGGMCYDYCWTSPTYASFFTVVSSYLRAADPDACIGAGTARHYSDWVIGLLHYGPDVGFYSWHEYAGGGSDQDVLNRTPNYGRSADNTLAYIRALKPDAQAVLGEYNPESVRNDTLPGAVFTASVLRHVASTPERDCIHQELFWEAEGSTWGLWSSSDPSDRTTCFYAKKLFADLVPQGCTVVSAATSDANLEVLAVVTDRPGWNVVLINKNSTSTTVNLALDGHGSEQGAWYTLDQASYDAGGISTQPASVPGGLATVTLAAYSVKGLALYGPQNIAPTAAFTYWPTHPLQSSPVEFDDLSSDADGTVVGWGWDFGDGGSSTAQNPSHTFADAGDHTVCLSVTDDDGAPATTCRNVAVDAPSANQPPVCSFTWSPYPAHRGDTVTFDATSSYDPDGFIGAYRWDFGDPDDPHAGEPGSGVIAEHHYQSSGDCHVALTVIDDAGAATTCHQVVPILNRAPIACATVPPVAAVGGTVAFGNCSYDPDGSLVACHWDFGDSAPLSPVTGIIQNPSFESSTLRWTLVGSNGHRECSTWFCGLEAYDGSCFLGSAVNLGGVSGHAYQTVSGLVAGTKYTVTVWHYTYRVGGVDGDNRNWVGVDPTAGTNANAATVIWSPASYLPGDGICDAPWERIYVQFVAQSGSATIFLRWYNEGIRDWYLNAFDLVQLWTGGPSESSACEPTYVYTTPGTYQACLTVWDDVGDSSTICQAIQAVAPVGQAPVCTFTHTPQPAARNQTITFDGSGSSDPDGVIVSYQWQFGDPHDPGAQASGSVVTYAYGDVGTYEPVLTVVDDQGNPATCTSQVEVVNTPPTACSSHPASALSGEEVTFVSCSEDPDGEALSCLWDFGHTVPLVPAPGHIVNPSFEYGVVGLAPDDWAYYEFVNPSGGRPGFDGIQNACPWYGGICPYEGARFVGNAASWAAKNGGLYQTIGGLTAGTPYRVTVWHRTYRLGGNQWNVSNRIGVDPTGGVDRYSSKALWSLRDYTDNAGPYEPISLDFTALGDRATIFIEMWQDQPVESSVNAVDAVDVQRGGAVTSTECTATHAFPTPGTYTVCLTVTDSDDATDSTCSEIEIGNRPPTCTVTHQPSDPGPGETVTLTCNGDDPDGAVVAATWTFGDGTTGDGLTVTHTYGAPGIYAVTCTCVDDLGASGLCGGTVVVWSVAETVSQTFDAGWQLLSLPLKPVDPDPAVVFAGIPINGNLYRFDPVARGYVMYESSHPDEFGIADLGMGMWLHLDTPATVSYQGRRASTTVGLPLSVSGWHLIGTPQPAAVPLARCVAWSDTQYLSLEQAVANGWIWMPCYSYQASEGGYTRVAFEAWSDDDSLRPWLGYWCYAAQSGVTLGVPLP